MKETYNENKEKKYEDKARELCGYDDAALLREAAAAEREWQQETESHPERAAELEQTADLNFEILMSKLNSEGLKPISERRYNRKQKWDNRDVTKVHKINRKAVVLVAVAALLVIGGSVGAIARNGYKYSVYPEQSLKNRLSIHNTSLVVNSENLEEAYKTVNKEIGLPVLMLGYMPEGMYLDKLVINDKYAIMEFVYEDNHFFLKESKPALKNRSDILISDRKNVLEIQNYWINETLCIEENKLDNGTTEFSVAIETVDGYYYFSGITSKEEFVEMSCNLMYQKKGE